MTATGRIPNHVRDAVAAAMQTGDVTVLDQLAPGDQDKALACIRGAIAYRSAAPPFNRHPTVAMTTPDGELAHIDEKLAPLIAEVWKAGLNTVHCCQDAGDLGGDTAPHLAERARYNAGYAYVEFGTTEVAAEFLTVIANAGPRGAFYERMTRWAAAGAWRKLVHFHDGSERRGNPSRFEPVFVQIMFPTTDIKEIVRRLRRHNNAVETA